jgi:drug/metabolite transporter (DMT)-like permease
VVGVVLVAQSVGLGLALLIALVRAEPMPSPADLGWAVAAGMVGGVGITALYQGLATGRMGVVAPVTGVLAATVPVLVGIALQGSPGERRLAGIGVALVAVVLVSRAAGSDGGQSQAGGRLARDGLGLGLLAGVGLGLFNVFASRLSAGAVFGPLVVVRAVEALFVGVAAIVTAQPRTLPRSVLPLVVLVGSLDMAGNGLFILSAQAGRLDVAAVLSSLYPVTTVVLAIGLLRERVSPGHAIGIAMAAAAIVLIASG